MQCPVQLFAQTDSLTQVDARDLQWYERELADTKNLLKTFKKTNDKDLGKTEKKVKDLEAVIAKIKEATKPVENKEGLTGPEKESYRLINSTV